MLPLVILVEDPATGATTFHRFDSGPIRLGRNVLNDLVIDHPAVSQFHAEVDFDETATRYADLGSTNGTLRGELRLATHEVVELGRREVLELGPLRVTFDRSPAPPMPEAEPATFSERLSAQAPGRIANTMAGKAATVAYDRAQAPPPRAPVAAAVGGAAPAAVPVGPPRIEPPRAPVANAAPAPPRIDARASASDGSAPGVSSSGVPASDAADAVERAIGAYRLAWEAVEHALHARLERMPPAQQARVLSELERKFPSLGQEPRYRALAMARRAELGSEGAVAAEALQRLGECVEHFDAPAPHTRDEIEERLVRLVRVLDTFAEAFVGLRGAYASFRAELMRARRRPMTEAPLLGEARDARQVAAYVMDAQAPLGPRVEELRRAFGELLAHQAALIGSAVDGARGALARVSPSAIDVELMRAGGPRGLLGWWKPMREAALWRRYVARYDELTRGGNLAATVLGAEFARAYGAFAGEQREPRAAGGAASGTAAAGRAATGTGAGGAQGRPRG